MRPSTNRIGALIRRGVNGRDRWAQRKDQVRTVTGDPQMSVETGLKSNQSGLGTV